MYTVFEVGPGESVGYKASSSPTLREARDTVKELAEIAEVDLLGWTWRIQETSSSKDVEVWAVKMEDGKETLVRL